MYLTFFFSNFFFNFFYYSLISNKTVQTKEYNAINSNLNTTNSYKNLYKYFKQYNYHYNFNLSCVFYKIYKINFVFSKTFFLYSLTKFFLNTNFINNIKNYDKNNLKADLFFFFSNFNSINSSEKLSYNFFFYKKLQNSSISFFYKTLSNFFIKYSVTDFFKYINNASINNLKIFFLRKNKVFNKGRYSRNRQYYRTGVYWCLYVNIVAVIGIYFWFYRFNMNFGYLWWILYFFIFTFFFSRSFSLGVFGLFKPFLQIFSSFIWFLSIIYSLFAKIFKFLKI